MLRFEQEEVMETMINKSQDIVEICGQKFSRAKSGLDEDQVESVVKELINEREMLLKRQEHLSSLNDLAERTVAEADGLAQQIKQQAMEQARAESEAMLARINEEAQQVIEDKKLEAADMAKTCKDLLSRVEDLRHKITAFETDFVQRLSDTLNTITEAYCNESATRSPGLSAHPADDQTSPADNQTPTNAPQEKALTRSEDDGVAQEEVPGENKDSVPAEVGALMTGVNGAPTLNETEIEILPPIDLTQVMEIVRYLDGLPEVTATEIIPQNDRAVIQAVLGKEIDLIEKLKELPCVDQLKEATNQRVADIGDATHRVSKGQKIELNLRSSSTAENVQTPNEETAHTPSS